MKDPAVRTPTWRTPEVWLVIGLPAVSLIAIAITLAIAARGSTDVAPNDVQRSAQIQLEDLAADREAARRRLQGSVEADSVSKNVIVTLRPMPDIAAVQLDVIHPVDAAQDQRVVLQRDGSRWVGPLTLAAGTTWHLRLTPVSGEWRLIGHLERGQRRTDLAPAVAAP